MKPIQLNQDNLPRTDSRVPRPTYDRSKLKTGIVHVGVGGFHRSHQAYYLHKLLEKYGDLNWGVCGIGLREADRRMYDILKKQDGLYTLIVQHPDGQQQCEVIGSLKEVLLAVDTPGRVIEKMAHPDTSIVSLTITEGGYNLSPSGNFNFANPVIRQELEQPDKPLTIFGYLTAALRLRRANGVPPFSVLSCDNIQHNGAVARKMVLAFAREQDPGLAEWIADNVSFPNTMVDRITPVTTSAEVDYLRTTYGLEDEWPVVCEPFIQWVVEDEFVAGRPPLEKVNVQFVPDVSPYEKMKIRLLNAGHSVLGIPGAVHGHPTIDACMNDAVFAGFMRRFMDEEATPVLGVIEGIDLDQYKDKLEERFANPNLGDSVSRICSESSAKLPKFLVPTLQENLVRGGSIKYATFILAAWCYYSDEKVDEKGQPIEIIDVMKDKLHRAAADGISFINQPEVFGTLAENERFVREYKQALQAIYQEKNIRKLMNDLS